MICKNLRTSLKYLKITIIKYNSNSSITQKCKLQKCEKFVRILKTNFMFQNANLKS